MTSVQVTGQPSSVFCLSCHHPSSQVPEMEMILQVTPPNSTSLQHSVSPNPSSSSLTVTCACPGPHTSNLGVQGSRAAEPPHGSNYVLRSWPGASAVSAWGLTGGQDLQGKKVLCWGICRHFQGSTWMPGPANLLPRELRGIRDSSASYQDHWPWRYLVVHE